MDQPRDRSSSDELISSTIPIRASGAISLGQERQIALLICHRHGVEAVPLVEGRAMTVGRDPGAEVPVPHPSLSRYHARFELKGAEIWVEDLGSTNGTRLNGQPIQRAQVSPGDELDLGSVTASVHVRSPVEGPRLQALVGHDRFLALMEDELTRHRTFGRKLGLLLMRTARPAKGGSGLNRWLPLVQQHLRPVDRLGLYGPATVEVLLPEMTAEALGQLAAAVVASREKGAPTVVCGAALFPDAATTCAGLIEGARTAAQQATARQPVVLSPSAGGALAGAVDAVVDSPEMKKVYAVAERMRTSKIPVLIVGETGTGKEVVARAIHGDVPLPCVNCAAIPEQLIESIMFGHERGAFTGADRQTKGMFAEADGGAILLDEIGELSPSAQAALLRVLDTKRITRVGSTKEIAVDVRILAATHRNLEAMCEAGTFRQDLLFRINTMTIKIPPLRERVEEIEPLAARFLHEANEANGTTLTGFEPEALELLRQYGWPGNVRELRNVVHRSAVMAQDQHIAVDDLPDRLLEAMRQGGDGSAPLQGAAATGDTDREADADVDYKTRIQRYETRLIQDALEQAGWSKTKAAQRLRIPLRTLIYKINSFGITR